MTSRWLKNNMLSVSVRPWHKLGRPLVPLVPGVFDTLQSRPHVRNSQPPSSKGNRWGLAASSFGSGGSCHRWCGTVHRGTWYIYQFAATRRSVVVERISPLFLRTLVPIRCHIHAGLRTCGAENSQTPQGHVTTRFLTRAFHCD